MKPLEALRVLIREDLNEPEGNEADVADTIDLQGSPPSEPKRGPIDSSALEASELARSFRDRPWAKLIVYRPDARGLWEVVPLNKGQNFAFYELRMSRVGDAIIPDDIAGLQKLEHTFDLDRGIGAPHVTVLR